MTDTPFPFAFYGTLMASDFRGGHLERNGMGRYGDACKIRGDLYDVGAFPALRPGDGTVTGQLWYPHPDRIDHAFSVIDGIEGYNSERRTGMYLRVLARLIEPDVLAWTYVWNYSMDRLMPIPSGDWRAHRDAQNADLRRTG